MSTINGATARSARGSRNSSPPEPMLRPHAGETVLIDKAAVEEQLNQLLGDAIGLTGELNAELDSLRPVLVREPSTETSYIAAMHRLDAAKQTAAEVRAALERLDDGSYGYCVTCLEPIPAGRLALRPQSAHCVKCG